MTLGEPSSTGEEVIELVAGGGGGSTDGLSRYFAPAEIQQILELERRAAVHVKAASTTT